MRIATSHLFDRPASLMARLNTEANAAQTRIATGKKLLAPSDDATSYLRLQGLQRATTYDSAYSANITMAQGVLAQSDSALEGVETQLQRALELATNAANGTLTDSSRAAIGKELEAIRDELFALANSKDVRGQPLFGGASGDAAFVRNADGSIGYAGIGTPSPIPVADGDAVQVTVPGNQAFASGATDMFAVLGDLVTALAGPGAQTAASSALAGIDGALDSVTLARASIGARSARLELDAARIADAGETREEVRSSIEDTDVAAEVTTLQKTLTILQATQASFTKLSGLSLFDYLR
ncbi:MAG: flagellar hook-associated protein FlgL [Sphingomonas sp.]|uniref:flagellar hook-associated protein FlgL n=1 Tax=Sphingomonas sp. TaxID=28214 RepID=UPI001B2BAE65|nr:flagellar hook-associated protein FlgL [Sphingomonas sp.]MBO9622005.1 flagellar hook-associated protein FlgL [Sphingomonas sp.]